MNGKNFFTCAVVIATAQVEIFFASDCLWIPD